MKEGCKDTEACCRSESVETVRVVRIDKENASGAEGTCDIVRETSVTLRVNNGFSHSFLCTPTELRELVVGSLFSESLIASSDEIVSISFSEQENPVVFVELKGEAKGEEDSKSCDSNLSSTLEVPPEVIYQAMESMFEKQRLYSRTRGSHASAVFDPKGNIVAFAEDIGRHNALDKVIGHCLLTGQETEGKGCVMSSRLSFELVCKAVRAEFEILAGVSSASSLAVTTARKANLTLCGRVRDRGMVVYSCPERLV